jgi:hypothetical protein
MAQSSAPCHSVVEEHPSHPLKSTATLCIPKNADERCKNKLSWWLQVLHPVRAKLMFSRPSLRREEECVVRSCSSSSDITYIYVDSDFAEAATACPSPNPCCKRRPSEANELGTFEFRSTNCWGQYTATPSGCASQTPQKVAA